MFRRLLVVGLVATVATVAAPMTSAYATPTTVQECHDAYDPIIEELNNDPVLNPVYQDWVIEFAYAALQRCIDIVTGNTPIPSPSDPERDARIAECNARGANWVVVLPHGECMYIGPEGGPEDPNGSNAGPYPPPDGVQEYITYNAYGNPITHTWNGWEYFCFDPDDYTTGVGG